MPNIQTCVNSDRGACSSTCTRRMDTEEGDYQDRYKGEGSNNAAQRNIWWLGLTPGSLMETIQRDGTETLDVSHHTYPCDRNRPACCRGGEQTPRTSPQQPFVGSRQYVGNSDPCSLTRHSYIRRAISTRSLRDGHQQGKEESQHAWSLGSKHGRAGCPVGVWGNPA